VILSVFSSVFSAYPVSQGPQLTEVTFLPSTEYLKLKLESEKIYLKNNSEIDLIRGKRGLCVSEGVDFIFRRHLISLSCEG
jgi:hypothetical protein